MSTSPSTRPRNGRRGNCSRRAGGGSAPQEPIESGIPALNLHREVQRRQIVWHFRLVLVVLVLACSGCAPHAGVSTSDVESVAKGNRVTLLVLGTGNKWAPRTEPDLYMLVAARNPTPTEKVQIDLSECQAAARTVWNATAAERDG